MTILTAPNLFQIAYFVQDVEEAANKWNRLYGAGPFHLLPHHEMEAITYRSRQLAKAEFPDVTYALGYMGDMQIQLTMQHDRSPSVFLDMYPNGGEGFHHMAYFADDLPGECERLDRLGVECACRFDSDGVSGAYYDTRTTNGGFTEVHTNPPSLLDMFAEWHREHKRWRPGDKVVIQP